MLEKNFKDYDIKGIDIVDFVKIFLNLLSHEEDETLYITVAIIDLFRDICESYQLSNKVRARDVLNYVVDVSVLRRLGRYLMYMQGIV